MPRRCWTCIHAERPWIDVELMRGVPPEQVAKKRPGLTRHSVARHKANGHHQTPSALVAHARTIVAANRDLHEVELEERQTWLEHLRHQRVELVEIQAELRRTGHLVQAGQVAHAILKNQELIARWLGELVSVNRTQVTHEHVLISDPAWPKLYAGLTRICERHPKVRAEVYALLEELQDTAGPPSAVGAMNGGQRVIEHVARS